jgi:hypothetical protein
VRSLIGSVKPVEVAPLKADPLHEDELATESPIVADPLAEPFPESLQPEVADEASLPAEEHAAKENTDDPLKGGAPLGEDESVGPAGLVFNPDAKHTPFTASTADFVPSAPEPTSGRGAFAEFGLAESSELEEQPDATASGDLVSEAALENSDEALISPEASTLEESVSVAPLEMELESSPLEISESDPLLEEQEPSDMAEELEFAQSEETAHEDPEDEARRLAFEQLFNSSELPPLERYDSSGTDPKILPNLADQSANHSWNVEPDPELEPLLDGRPSEHAAAERDPFLMEELEPMNAVGQIPDRDSMLDRGAEPDWAAKKEPAQEHVESFDHKESETISLEPGTQTDPMLMPALEVRENAPQPESNHPLTFGEVPEAISAEAAEILEPVSEPVPLTEAVPEQSPALDEVEELAPAAPLADYVAEPAPVPEHLEQDLEQIHEQDLEPLIASEAAVAPAEPEAPLEALLNPEPMHFEPESESLATRLVSEPAREIEPELAPLELEAAASIPEHIEPELTPVSAEPELAAAGIQAAIASREEKLHAAISGSLDDQERVQQAVDRVFNRFKRLLVTAIVRELARND